jgi:hypothetical protein
MSDNRILLVAGLSLFLLTSCQDDGQRISAPIQPELSTSFSVEAQSMAVWISGEIRPPASLTRRIDRHLTLIRTRYEDEIESLGEIRFRPAWLPGSILLGLDEASRTEVASGTYNSWDTLNELYGATFRYHTGSLMARGFVEIRSTEILHSGRLAAEYRTLPGVRYSHPNNLVGDGSNIYPGLEGSRARYLFRKGGGDCPSGCTENEYWYFIMDDEKVAYVGSWNDQTPLPSWWPEARELIEQYRADRTVSN